MTVASTDPSPTRSALSPAQQRLLARIGRRYQVVTASVAIGPLRFDFTRIADPDRVLDEVAAEVDRRERVTGRRELEPEPLHLPYWAELWDSAAGVSQWLAREWDRLERERTSGREPPSAFNAETPAGADAQADDVAARPEAPGAAPSVLDLGCGMGLTGTVAAGLGARVLFADLERPALLFARLNSLPFDEPPGRVRTRQLNWQRDRLGERFDMILGADILYERAQWPHLEPFWRAHLAGGGSVVVGEPGRAAGDAFPDWIRARGWSVRQVDEPVATRERPIRIFVLGLEQPT